MVWFHSQCSEVLRFLALVSLCVLHHFLSLTPGLWRVHANHWSLGSFSFLGFYLCSHVEGSPLSLLRRSVWVCCFLFFVQRNFLFVVVEVAYAMARFQF